MYLTSFGDYTFPEEQAAYGTNFSNAVPTTTRLPGLSGGYSDDGDAAAPNEIGNIRIDFTLVAQEPEDMEPLRDAVRAMRGWGLKRLYAQPTDPDLPARWCYARVNNISLPERLDEHTDLFQPASINFQVTDPRWFLISDTVAVWGNFKWGDGSKWGSDLTPISASGLTTNTTLTNSGTAETNPRITIYCGAGQSVTNPKIQRLIGNRVVDEVSWIGTLSAGDLLVIDARAMSVKKNGQNAYSETFTSLHPAWLRLVEGDNSIRISFGNVSDAAKVTFTYDEAYF